MSESISFEESMVRKHAPYQQIQVYCDGVEIGYLYDGLGDDFWGLSGQLVERYGRGHNLIVHNRDQVQRWVWALEAEREANQ